MSEIVSDLSTPLWLNKLRINHLNNTSLPNRFDQLKLIIKQS